MLDVLRRLSELDISEAQRQRFFVWANRYIKRTASLRKRNQSIQATILSEGESDEPDISLTRHTGQ